MRHLKHLGCLVLLLGLVALGSDAPVHVAGKWKMTLKAPKSGPPHTKLLSLEQKGEELKGTLKDEGGELPIAGTIKGNDISLSGKRFGITVKLKALIEKDRMTGTLDVLTIHHDWTAEQER